MKAFEAWLTVGSAACSLASLVSPRGGTGLVGCAVALGGASAIAQFFRLQPPAAPVDSKPQAQVDPQPADEEYELLSVLGQGSMGQVWRARHRKLGRIAAVKVLERDKPDVDVARFEREAVTMSSLRSPNTVTVYGFGTRADGSRYYAMELLDGIDLQSFVREQGTMPVARVVHILRQACDSLREAHAVGLIHRDVKPANLFLCRTPKADLLKVVDFGLAKDQRSRADLTRPSSVLGTAAYLAPESALGGSKAVDGRADVYALGCIAFWLVTGRMVFPETSIPRMIQAHINGIPDRMSKIAEQEVPAAFEDMIEACLSKDPATRPDAEALSLKLESLAAELTWTEAQASRWWSSKAEATDEPS